MLGHLVLTAAGLGVETAAAGPAYPAGRGLPVRAAAVLRAAAVTALNREYNQSSEWGGILIFSQSKSSVRKI